MYFRPKSTNKCCDYLCYRYFTGISKQFSFKCNKLTWKKNKRNSYCQNRKRIYFIYFEWSYEWYYYNHKIIRIFKYINWWYFWNSKTWKKKEEGGFLSFLLATIVASLVQPEISSVVKGISGIEIRRAGRGYIDTDFSVLLYSLSNISITSLDLMAFFHKIIYLE